MIVFDSVSLLAGQRPILDRVSCQISGGEFVSIIGRSGAGKSSFINLLIGALRASSGKLTVDGLNVAEFSDRELALYRRRLGIVFQDFKLLPKKTVAENIAFALEVCGEPGSLIKKRVPEVLEIVGLQRRSQAYPAELSGGEKQRCGIARALIHEPALIIADEPTGNLDPETGRGIMDLLVDINSAGATVLLATHDRDTVNRLQRRVLRLEGGKLVSDLAAAGYDSPRMAA